MQPEELRGVPYAPGDRMWQVNRESVLLLAGPRALLLQLAHPLVAAGVADHARFQQDPLGRLRRTLDTMLFLIYGPAAEGRDHAARVAERHRSVHGRLRHATRQLPAGTPYSAADPQLLFWVHATLIDSALRAYEEFVAPLSPEARAAFYQESKRMAPPFGLPVEALPADLSAFEAEMHRWISDGRLEVTPDALRLAEDVLHPPLRMLPRSVTKPLRTLTFGLLPPTLRAQYGVVWGPREERRYARQRRWVRRVRPWLPAALREMPHARRAARTREPAPASAADGGVKPVARPARTR